MIERISYWFWKRMAKKAIEKGLTAVCCQCADPIIPGDFVGLGIDTTTGKDVFVHAGYHFAISGMDACCESGSVGCGHWDGEKVVRRGESMIEVALKTGEAQVR